MPATRSVAALASLAALAGAAPATAQAPAPTLTFDRPCYSAAGPLTFQGAGFTPGGRVDLLFATAGSYITTSLQAGADGTFAGPLDPPDADTLVPDDEERTLITVTANDRTRIDAGAGPASQLFAAAQFTLSRLEALYLTKGDRLRPGRPATYSVFGFVTEVGRPLYAHFRRGRRTLATVRLGTLEGPCGDARRRLSSAFPFRHVPAGTYKLDFDTARSGKPTGTQLRYEVRVPSRYARP